MRVWEGADENALMEEHKREEVVGEGKRGVLVDGGRFGPSLVLGWLWLALGADWQRAAYREMALSGWPSCASGGPVGRVSWAWVDQTAGGAAKER